MNRAERHLVHDALRHHRPGRRARRCRQAEGQRDQAPDRRRHPRSACSAYSIRTVSDGGDPRWITLAPMSFERVLVVGAGQMGAGIAQVVAASGRRCCSTIRFPARSSVASPACRRASRGSRRRAAPSAAEVLGRVTETSTSSSPADLMIEAIVEDVDAKHELFRAADEALPRSAILASNTSSIPITTLAAATSRPGPRDRHALLQPGARAAARRGDPGAADLRRDGGRDRRASPAISARSRPRRTTSRASSPTAS